MECALHERRGLGGLRLDEIERIEKRFLFFMFPLWDCEPHLNNNRNFGSITRQTISSSLLPFFPYSQKTWILWRFSIFRETFTTDPLSLWILIYHIHPQATILFNFRLKMPGPHWKKPLIYYKGAKSQIGFTREVNRKKGRTISIIK